MRKLVERINDEIMLKMFDIFMLYPCLTSQEVKQLRFQRGNTTVIIDNPVNSIRSWKTFLYCLWRAENVESAEFQGKEVVVVTLPKKRLRALLKKNELAVKGLRNLLIPLANVMYWIEERKGNTVETIGFRLLYIFEGEEDLKDEEKGLVKLYVDGDFYRFCMNSNVFLYAPFLIDIHSIFAANLFMYLTANQDVNSFSEAILFERLGFLNQLEKEKRRILKESFEKLKNIGYIKSFSYVSETKRWTVERYDSITLRSRALDRLHFIKQRDQKLKVKQREKTRRWRQRKRLIAE